MSHYQPWIAEGISELEYWKIQYIKARQDCKVLAEALEFIRDCEDDGEEMGPIVTVSFLKEQARAILQRYPI